MLHECARSYCAYERPIEHTCKKEKALGEPGHEIGQISGVKGPLL